MLSSSNSSSVHATLLFHTQVGLRRLAFKFAAEDITPEMLPFLDDNTMRDLGVSSVGARLRLRMLAGTARQQGGA